LPEPLSDVEEPASRDQEAKEFIEEVLLDGKKAWRRKEHFDHSCYVAVEKKGIVYHLFNAERMSFGNIV